MRTIAWFLISPSNVTAIVAATGLLLVATRRWRRVGLTLAGCGLSGALLAGFLPVGNWAILPLEQRFPAFRNDGRSVDGIIVLSGAVDMSRAVARDEFALNGAAERVFAFLDLARRYPDARLVYTGGPAGLPEAAIAARYLESVGLPPDRLTLETRSRSTFENARYTQALIKPASGERWILITSARHMPRAVGAFRRVGFSVIPYPVDFQTHGLRDVVRPFGALSAGLQRLDFAAYEWFGLAAYRASGQTGTFFPGPEPDLPRPVAPADIVDAAQDRSRPSP